MYSYKKPVRLVGSKKYLVATDQHDVTAEEIAYIYRLSWDIENILRMVEMSA